MRYALPSFDKYDIMTKNKSYTGSWSMVWSNTEKSLLFQEENQKCTHCDSPGWPLMTSDYRSRQLLDYKELLHTGKNIFLAAWTCWKVIVYDKMMIIINTLNDIFTWTMTFAVKIKFYLRFKPSIDVELECTMLSCTYQISVAYVWYIL